MTTKTICAWCKEEIEQDHHIAGTVVWRTVEVKYRHCPDNPRSSYHVTMEVQR